MEMMKNVENKIQNSKKIIALACSPSKGRNSDTMLDNFIIGINQFSKSKNIKIEIEKIYLNDVKINLYKYDNRLSADGDEPEFAELAEKIKNADGLIIATPTYNFSVPAQLKNFIDRIRFIALDLSQRNRLGQPVGKLGNLATYFLVTGGIPKYAEKILFFAFPAFWLRGVFLYYGAKVFGAYYTGNIKAFEDKNILEICKKKGAKYAGMVACGRGNRILERIFWRPPTEN